jgi:predicted anti-sigma-YlaC factor YlaD
MNADRCRREDELLDALGRGFVGAELAAHIAECPSCAEVHLVAGAFFEERVDAITEAPVPSAGTMLWRMQMRQRREAQATARRSLLVGQAATLVVAIALVVALFGADLAIGIREVVSTIRLSTPLLLALAAWVLAAPIAGYVAIRQK